MKRAVSYAEHQPIASINITPLIDVMLVLLIMLIITIPSTMHKLPIDLPTGRGTTAPEAPPHLLDIDASGALRWDGRAIDDGELSGLLAATVAAGGVLRVKTDQVARYERFHSIMAQVRRAGVTRLGFVGNEAMRF
jgi:biopolymer transport protein ExbD